MDLPNITEIVQPGPDAAVPEWRDGDAWLAGGTWLFSEPQPQLRRLVDLAGLEWTPLAVTKNSLEIAATCTIAELYDIKLPADWLAAPLIQQCCRSFLSSFKIWTTATVGGNICMSLPAGPMISRAAGLEATWSMPAYLLARDGMVRRQKRLRRGRLRRVYGLAGWQARP